MRPDPQESPRGLKRRMDAVRRDIQNKQSRSAATGIQAALKGYDQTLRIDEKSGNDVARNVLARIEGTDPQLKSQVDSRRCPLGPCRYPQRIRVQRR